MRFAADYSETLEVFFIPFKFHYHQTNIQCVHKVHLGFWKIVARKQIELATCGLRQITAKLWKFLLSHSNSFITKHTVCPQSPLGVLKNCGAQTNWASHMWFAAEYSETLEVFLSHSNSIITRQTQCVHKVHSGFWKIVARKQIELATCGLRQITAKLWKRSSACGICRAMHGLFPHIRRSHPVCHFSCP
jgi:hypothetical protein